jgi:predicted ArsR family transcriptional regulator
VRQPDLTTPTARLIFAVLVREPGRDYTYRQLADEVGCAPGTASEYARAYEKDGLVDVFAERRGGKGRPACLVRVTAEGVRRHEAQSAPS